ncbi:hypothetical protein M422DRAFT_276008 [Sphaerobolus stellatus SS14]|uniref:Uncharacterized protein n=1 Tax=Sphaerobolus stellatus (strain SS14) TaxID=990650 RepID=A0A0C9UDF1_SPHS4|nr:hypothetical protein M422DRAFT_276008 [Sphaerobolus stellatus SS14]
MYGGAEVTAQNLDVCGRESRAGSPKFSVKGARNTRLVMQEVSRVCVRGGAAIKRTFIDHCYFAYSINVLIIAQNQAYAPSFARRTPFTNPPVGYQEGRKECPSTAFSTVSYPSVDGCPGASHGRRSRYQRERKVHSHKNLFVKWNARMMALAVTIQSG